MSSMINTKIRISGTVFWYGSEERVSNAVVKATSQTGHTLLSLTDDDGDFSFTDLEPGKWRILVLHEQGVLNQPQEQDLIQDKTDFRFDLFRRMGTIDASAGRLFFACLIIGLVLLTAVYIVLHAMRPAVQSSLSMMLIPLLEKAQGQATSTETLNESPVLQDTAQRIYDVVERGLADALEVSSADKESLMALLTRVQESIKESRKEAMLADLANLWQSVEALPPREYFWSLKPWRYLEVLLWGLAGVLVNKIIVCGTYLRWRSFYREGIVMHVSHLIAIPVIVLVVTLLVSLITFTATLPGNNEVQMNLTDPAVLVAFSFLLGSRPWSVWRFMQSAADRVTGQGV